MSRIGAKSIALPAGVAVAVTANRMNVKGPKGELSHEIAKGFNVAVDTTAKTVTVGRPGDGRDDKAKHGLYRALLNNMIKGVSAGFDRNLEIEGVGYNAKLDGKSKLVLNIGFCLPVSVDIPVGVLVETPKPTIILIKGQDKQLVGQFAAKVRGVRPPEPYKGKGIRYQGEVLERKQGKAVGGKG